MPLAFIYLFFYSEKSKAAVTFWNTFWNKTLCLVFSFQALSFIIKDNTDLGYMLEKSLLLNLERSQELEGCQPKIFIFKPYLPLTFGKKPSSL